MKLRVRVRRYEKFGRLARRLRDAADGGLQRDAVAELQAAAEPVLGRVRATVLSASFPADRPASELAGRKAWMAGSGEGWYWKLSPEAGSTGLRARLAGATHVDPLPRGNGVRFAVEYGEVDERWGRRLAMLTDVDTAHRWRHPVFDNREVWVTQHGRPWFHAPITAGYPEYEAGVRRAMERTARKITGGR